MKETAAELKSEYLNGLLYLEPIGEIDHHTAKALPGENGPGHLFLPSEGGRCCLLGGSALWTAQVWV